MVDTNGTSHPFKILRTVDQVREWRNGLQNPDSVGFVPTMGALHPGHLQLVRHSLSSQEHTVVSIFLNPAQFAPNEDLSSYPCTLDLDLALLAELSVQPSSFPVPHSSFDGQPLPTSLTSVGDRKVSAVFLPTKDILYPSGIAPEIENQRGAFVVVHGLSEQLEGARRPGFFRGVATVVLKLFLIVEPNIAFFGQKDLQQCLVVRQLCKDLHLARPASIVVIPTVRDSASGLALSSRNVYLSETETIAAQVLFGFLRECASRLMSSPTTLHTDELAKNFKPPISSISLDFISLNDPLTFKSIIPNTPTQNLPLAISGAILVQCASGREVRLIDNIVINYDLNRSI